MVRRVLTPGLVPMGNWTFTLQGTGCHHNRDAAIDADLATKAFVKTLLDQGHPSNRPRSRVATGRTGATCQADGAGSGFGSGFCPHPAAGSVTPAVRERV
jgi:hypothetical protein